MSTEENYIAVQVPQEHKHIYALCFKMQTLYENNLKLLSKNHLKGRMEKFYFKTNVSVAV